MKWPPDLKKSTATVQQIMCYCLLKGGFGVRVYHVVDHYSLHEVNIECKVMLDV